MAERVAGTAGWMGEAPARVDGPGKLCGATRYAADAKRDGVLHAAVVRSEVARGKLIGIELDPGFDWTGIVVVTASDIAKNVVAEVEEDLPIVASGEIRHMYEPVALLACEDPVRLERAKAHVRVEVEALPAVLTIEQALACEAVIYGTDNVMRRCGVEQGDAPSAIEASEVKVRGTYRVGHQEHVYLEPQVMVAWWDGDGVHVEGSLQCPYYVHHALVHALGEPNDRVQVRQAVTGGAFGGKEDYPSVIALQMALLSRKAGGRAVRIVFDRKEDIEATTKRHPARVELQSGCDRDGTLRALEAKVVLDAGAYHTLTPVVLSRAALHAAGAYRWEHVRVEACAVATNTPPNGAFRGFGAPQVLFAVERHLDAIARELGMDPLELRKKNLLGIESVTPSGQVLESSVGVRECVEVAEARSGYREKRRRLGVGNCVGSRTVRGIGASVVLHGAGFTGSGEERLKGVVAVDLLPGGRVRVRSSSTEMGQGTETVFRQIAAEGAGVPFDRIEVAVPVSGIVPDSGPTVASRTVMVVGELVRQAASDLGERVRREIEAGGGDFAAAGDRLLAREGAVECKRQFVPAPGAKFDDATYRGVAYGAYGWACNVVEVEVDLDTCEVKVVGLWTATDVGRVVHPVLCAGQVEGGTLQALGWALWEELLWKDGRIVNPRMTSYIVPTSLDAPPMVTELIEAPYERGPGGAKGVGELPMDGGAPAVAAAIEHATGLSFASIPITPERIYDALQKAGREARS